MTREQLLKNLQTPAGPIDVVLDTDTYNEIDDQFALAYLLASSDKLHLKALCAAPFYNSNSSSPADGMEKSYQEIKNLLRLAGRSDLEEIVRRGSCGYLPDEKTPVASEAADTFVKLARGYSAEKPLYVVAIGAITNVASALLTAPEIRDNIVIVWLGGHAQYWPNTMEFNMLQDVAAARVVFGCGAPLVQLPCGGIVEQFAASGPELEYWLRGQNALCDYLVQHTVDTANAYAAGKVWSRVIWDVTAVGWLLNEDDRFMSARVMPAPIPQYDHHYGYDFTRHPMAYVWHINRDALMQDLFARLRGMKDPLTADDVTAGKPHWMQDAAGTSGKA